MIAVSSYRLMKKFATGDPWSYSDISLPGILLNGLFEQRVNFLVCILILWAWLNIVS